jgi:hypothetical protein
MRSWSIAAALAPFVVLLLFLAIEPLHWDYRVGIAVAEAVGVVCLSRLPCARWVRGLCIAIYIPVGAVVFHLFSIFVIWGILGPHLPM